MSFCDELFKKRECSLWFPVRKFDRQAVRCLPPWIGNGSNLRDWDESRPGQNEFILHALLLACQAVTIGPWQPPLMAASLRPNLWPPPSRSLAEQSKSEAGQGGLPRRRSAGRPVCGEANECLSVFDCQRWPVVEFHDAFRPSVQQAIPTSNAGLSSTRAEEHGESFALFFSLYCNIGRFPPKRLLSPVLFNLFRWVTLGGSGSNLVAG